MSGDGPSKLTPEALALDDIILSEDDTSRVPEHALGSDGTNGNTHASDRPAEAKERKRAKMTLRIPDDEVSRPQVPGGATPSGGVFVARPPPDDNGPPLQPQRILSIGGSADDTVEIPAKQDMPRASGFDAPLVPPPALVAPQPLVAPRGASASGRPFPSAPPALGIDPTTEPGWTPFQPTVEQRPEAKRPLEARPISAVPATEESPPISEDIPVDTDDGGYSPPETHPRMASALDSEEIRIEDGERITDPAEGTEEVSPEDLVSIESIPHPRHPPAASTPRTATALMAGAPLPIAPTPVAPPVASSATSSPSGPSAAAQPSQPSQPQAAPAPSNLAARRPVSASATTQPFAFVPPVGALAPPPMNEAAANRKKIRPWWEELFNDDFIRTMAKVTDRQIGREVTFIEESLGCEAGAMILDLACGTGQHAIALAARGYQVVGFDLSLPMLARAADEAQDKKQKLNFVQGDMREMTFEETFDGVYCWNTSFGFFDEEKNAAVVARVHRALKKGGQFLLDVVNRDYIIRQAPSLAWFEGDGCICMDEMTIDSITSRMKVKRTLMMDDGRTKEIEYSVRLYALHELGKLLHDNGFRVAEVSGRTATPGVFFGCESPRTLILAEKR